MHDKILIKLLQGRIQGFAAAGHFTHRLGEIGGEDNALHGREGAVQSGDHLAAVFPQMEKSADVNGQIAFVEHLLQHDDGIGLRRHRKISQLGKKRGKGMAGCGIGRGRFSRKLRLAYFHTGVQLLQRALLQQIGNMAVRKGLQKTLFSQDGALSRKQTALRRALHQQIAAAGRRHLTGQSTAADQLIEQPLLFGERLPQLLAADSGQQGEDGMPLRLPGRQLSTAINRFHLSPEAVQGGLPAERDKSNGGGDKAGMLAVDRQTPVELLQGLQYRGRPHAQHGEAVMQQFGQAVRLRRFDGKVRRGNALHDKGLPAAEGSGLLRLSFTPEETVIRYFVRLLQPDHERTAWPGQTRPDLPPGRRGGHRGFCLLLPKKKERGQGREMQRQSARAARGAEQPIEMPPQAAVEKRSDIQGGGNRALHRLPRLKRFRQLFGGKTRHVNTAYSLLTFGRG